MPKNFKLNVWNVVKFEKKHIIKENDLRVEIHHVGGRTGGSSIVYFPLEKIVFAGDIIFEAFQHIIFLGAKWNFDDWIAALDFLNTLPIDKIIPGHGSVLTSKGDLGKYIELYHTLRAVVKEAIKENRRLGSIVLPKLEYLEELKRISATKPLKLKTEYEHWMEKGKEMYFQNCINSIRKKRFVLKNFTRYL